MNDKLSFLITAHTQLNKKIEKFEEDHVQIKKSLDSITDVLNSKLPEYEKVMRVKEVVEMLEISRSKLYRLTQAKKLPCTYLDGTPFYLWSELLAVFKKLNKQKPN